jgi:hypothetical protein
MGHNPKIGIRTFAGEVPLGKAFWSGLPRRKAPINWEKASGRLSMEGAQVAAFSWLLPKVLSSEGRLNLDLSVLPGLKLDGTLNLTEASTLPLEEIGIIRDIDAELKRIDETGWRRAS